MYLDSRKDTLPPCPSIYGKCLQQLSLSDKILLLVTDYTSGPVLQQCPITTEPVVPLHHQDLCVSVYELSY